MNRKNTNETARLLAHAALGAASAYISGNSATSGALVASGKIPYSDFDRWSVNGSVAIIKYPDGSIAISDTYNYDLKPNISSTLRNIETYLGNPNTPTNNGVEFKFNFTGEFKLQEDY